MAAERVDFIITAETDRLQRELAQAEKAFKELGESAETSQEDMDKATRALFRATKAAEKMAPKTKKAKNELEGLKFAAQGAGGRVGEMAGRVENLSRGLGSIGVAGGAAVLAGAAVIGVGIAAIGAAKAIGVLVRQGSEAVTVFREMSEAGFGVGAELPERLDTVEASLTAVQAAGGLLIGDVVAYWTPAIRTFSAIAVTGALELRDTYIGLGPVTSTLQDNIESLTEIGFGAQVGVVLKLVKANLALFDLMGIGIPDSVRKSINALEDVDQIVARRLTPDLADLAEGMGFNIDRGLQWVEQLDAIAASGGAAAGATSALADATAATALALAKAKAQADAIKALSPKKDNEPLDKSMAIAAQEAQALKNAQDGTNSSLGTSIDLATSLFSVIGRGAAEQQKNAKAVALGNIAIDTAAGLVKSIATLGPPIPPNVPGILGAASVAATGAASAAKVNQSFDIGGVVQGGQRYPNGTPGQVQVQAEVGEVFFSQGQLDALGGAMGGGGVTSVNLVVGNRTTEAIVIQNQRAGGSLSQMRTPRATSQQRYSR